MNDFIEDAQIISEQSLSDSNVPSWLVNLADKFTGNHKGFYVTNFLIGEDLVKDQQKIRLIYNQHHDSIDQYFNQVDLNKVNQKWGGDLVKQIDRSLKDKIRQNMPGILGGAAVGAGLTIVLIKALR